MGLGISFLRRYRIFKARRAATGPLSLGAKVRFDVPVRVIGPGSVTIASRSRLGYPSGIIMGDGAILLRTGRPEATIQIGANCSFSNNISVVAETAVVIGDDCLIGDQVMIVDSDFHGIAPAERRLPGKSVAVTIGNNVWLGSRAVILKGVTIGDDAVVAAGALVTSDVPAGTLVAGIPAKVIRRVDTPSA